MKIISIRLENFKGVESREIFANGANVIISGQNGTGKTTIADAYFWIFTGKFADGTSGEVNFFDADGKLIRDKKIHAVEIELDDKTTIRRESVNTFDKLENFKSTTQNFFIDGVELKQKDFDAEIGKITGGAALNPFGFCQMSWKERRNILMKMCKVDDSAVVASDEIFQNLNLGKFTPDVFITAKKSEIKKLTAELQGIPARIDELSHKKFSVEGDEETLKAEIEKTKADLKAAADKVAQIQKFLAEREEKERLQELVSVQSVQIEEMRPKASYYDLILQSKEAIPVSVIAKDYGMSGKAMNQLLHDLKIQYRCAGTWLVYQDYAARGYTVTKTIPISDDFSKTHTNGTQKGRLFLYEVLKQHGHLPLIEQIQN